MGTGDVRADKKVAELAQVVAAACASVGEPIDEQNPIKFVNDIAEVTPPRVETRYKWSSYEDAASTSTLSIMGVGGTDAVTRKAGNVTLNMGHLMSVVGTGGLAAFTVILVPWAAVFAALAILPTLYMATTVNLSEIEGAVLWTMWMRRNPKDNTTPNDNLRRALNAERKKYERSEVSQRELEDALHKLERIKTITRYSRDRSRWLLHEKVVVQYE